MDDTKIVRYSNSKIDNQATCPARNYFAVLAREGKIETDPAYPLVYGSAAHKGIEMAIRDGANPFTVANEEVQKELTDKYKGKNLNAATMAKKQEEMTRSISNWVKKIQPGLMPQVLNPDTQVEVTLQAPYRKGIMTGIIDFIYPDGTMVDWKTGTKIPKMETLIKSTQAATYFWLAQQVGMKLPYQFDFAYLYGQNINMTRTKEGKPTPDKANPNYKTRFSVSQDPAKVARIFAAQIDPVAKLYEEGVIYKKVTDMNCSGCQYRTACWQTELPSEREANEHLVVDIVGLVTDEEG